MAVSNNITLINPGVLVYGTMSIQGISEPDLKHPVMQFGLVSQVYPLCETVNVGQNIMFVKDGASIVTYSNTNYFLVPEQNIKLIEAPAP